jgi:hypothetical protein
MSGSRGNGLRSLATRCAIAGVLALVVGCAASRGQQPTGNAVAIDPALSGRAQGRLTQQELVGVWALTDRRNSTFNIRLSEDGQAVSTWSSGPQGAIGERGHWRLEDGRAVIDWDSGWQDTLAVGLMGTEQWSWGPGEDRSGLPRVFGMAVPIRDAMAEFVGVWQMRGVLPGDPAIIYVAIQSDGMVFKNIGEYRYGCWSVTESVPAPGRAQRGARITWANGWFDELSRDAEGYFVNTWTPSADRRGAPTATNRVRAVE